MQHRLTNAQAADLLGLSPNSLERWRMNGRGPAFYQVGRRIFYDATDVTAWLVAQRVDPEQDRR